MNEIIDYVMNSPQNTNPNVLRGLLESFASGSNSDYTIAEVSIVNNTNNSLSFTAPTIAHYETDNEYLESFVNISGNETITLNIVLYKGKAHCLTLSDNLPFPVCSGGVEDAGHGEYFIAGNGTIIFGTAN